MQLHCTISANFYPPPLSISPLKFLWRQSFLATIVAYVRASFLHPLVTSALGVRLLLLLFPSPPSYTQFSSHPSITFCANPIPIQQPRTPSHSLLDLFTLFSSPFLRGRVSVCKSTRPN